jgi:hypothetical protein
MNNSNGTLRLAEVRILVDAYCRSLECAERLSTPSAAEAPSSEFCRLSEGVAAGQNEIYAALDHWSDGNPAARWAKRVAGVSPAMAAGLAAHIDIARCPTVGRIWRFAGLDPTRGWEPGQPRPWNPSLKMLCSRIGENFAQSSGEGSFYGDLYLQRKQRESSSNEAGVYADQAAAKLRDTSSRVDIEARRCCERGRLAPEHIEARARRWAVKLFLAHYHHVAWSVTMGAPPPRPYVIGVMGQPGYIAPPNIAGGVL